ncbi:YodC family protein [Aureimonas sp. SK2]|uniref:YodC family protein n=1 Tax=Aureimonas sp. SK2 TaxID=3015992 RepID=UPI0024452B7D|nr:DUF2158 domain-containing protein [Aureimonas sp. SK2]
MAEKFKPGDIVQLKSGGPKMTVDHLDTGDAWVTVKWFAGSKMEGARVRTTTVEAYVEPPKTSTAKTF